MKRCPQCGKTYDDQSLNFCLEDGASLALNNSEATVVIAKPVVRKKRRVLAWVGAVLVLILLGMGTLIGLLFYYWNSGGENVRVNVPRSVNATPSPKRSASPRPSPTASSSVTPASSREEEPSPAKDENDQNESDEVTPIAWTTSALGFKTDVGRKFKFGCPPNGTASAVWGSDIYTADSSICTAAVHAGLISLERGGTVTIEFRPGRQIYGSTERNGVTTYTFGEYAHSFVVK